MELFAKSGQNVEFCIWDKEENWERFQIAVLKSPWDFYLKQDLFYQKLDEINKKVPLVLNSTEMVKWSIQKYLYLQQLQAKGINLIPTLFIEDKLDAHALHDLIKTHSCDTIVVKPGIGAGSVFCERFAVVDVEKAIEFANHLLKTQPVLIQPYMKSIESGERSLLYVDRKFQHACIKVPKKGDYRCQADYGGSRERFTPSDEEIAFGQRVVDCVGDFLYGRVDYLYQNDKFYLMEFELDSPYLYSGQNPSILTSFVDAVVSRLKK